MLFFILILCAFGLGALIALQPVVNATMANQVGSVLMASLCSMGISMVIIVVAWVSLGRGAGNWSALPTLPWWVIIGGIAGAFIVCGGMLIVPRIGVQKFFVCLIAGQLLCAALVDHFGLFGQAAAQISLSRLTGIALVFLGVYMTHSRLLD